LFKVVVVVATKHMQKYFKKSQKKTKRTKPKLNKNYLPKFLFLHIFLFFFEYFLVKKKKVEKEKIFRTKNVAPRNNASSILKY